jgi:hypothetical protein
MYPLLPWKWIGGVLTLITLLAVSADDVQRLTGIAVPDQLVVRYLPFGVLLLIGGFFGPTCYFAPWRVLWRFFPTLNNWLPDLNGIWVGATNSNWPTIERLVEAAKSYDRTTEQELHDCPEQQDAMAVRFTNSLFKLEIRSGLSSMNCESFSIVAKPWRDQHTGQIHLAYVYQQDTPNHAITDDEMHEGAAHLVLVAGNHRSARGTYWNKRAWRTGRNTAGTFELNMVSAKGNPKKSLLQYAQEHKKLLAQK